MSIDSVLGKRKIQENIPDSDDSSSAISTLEKRQMRQIFDISDQILQTYLNGLDNAASIAKHRRKIAEDSMRIAKIEWLKAWRYYNGTSETIPHCRYLLDDVIANLQTAINQIHTLPYQLDVQCSRKASCAFQMLYKVHLECLDEERVNKFTSIFNKYANSFQKYKEFKNEKLALDKLNKLHEAVYNYDLYLEELPP